MENINIDTGNDICKFCNTKGDLGVDHKYLFQDNFDFGILGELEADCYISKCNRERKPVLEVQYDITTADRTSEDLGVRRIEINYCPFCGRELI